MKDEMGPGFTGFSGLGKDGKKVRNGDDKVLVRAPIRSERCYIYGGFLMIIHKKKNRGLCSHRKHVVHEK
jgi:hypothetical protein